MSGVDPIFEQALKPFAPKPTQAPTVSPYVEAAADRAASQPSEAEARARREGSNVVAFPSAADEARDRITEEATRAFWQAARLAQPLPRVPHERTTAQLLQHAKNHAHRLWAEENLTEEEFNAAMLEFCWGLADGDELKAQLLASAVIV